MSNIFSIINHLYTNRNGKWITELNDTDIQPFVIQKWLCMNDRIRTQTRWLDKYVFVLSPKMYLSLAWSVIPKTDKAPFVKYIKKLEEEEEYDFILSRIRKQFKLSDNDYKVAKPRLISAIKLDMVNWFSYYGIEKRFWKKYMLNFNQIKEYNKKENPQKGLGAWGI